MGCWMIAKDEIYLGDAVDQALIDDFIRFNSLTCPESYRREIFGNTWFFNSENTLVSHAGKFAEPSIWYKHMKEHFFEPRGINLPEEINFLGEGEEGFESMCRKRQDEYFDWHEKMSGIKADMRLLTE